MTIEFDHLMKALTFAVSIGSAIYAWLASHDKATAGSIRELEVRLNEMEKANTKSELELHAKVQALEAKLANVPSQEAIHKLELGMQDVRGGVDQLREQWTQTQHSIRRMEQFLLDARAARKADDAREASEPAPPKRRARS
jgi:hypothetical protein